MLALGIVLLLAAEGDAERPTRFTGALNVSAVLPMAGSWPATGGVDVGFEPIPQLRILLAHTFLYRTLTVPGGPLPRLMLGVEGIITPVLPLELALGAATGLTAGGITDVFPPGYTPGLTVQARAFIGYRFRVWLSAGLLASGNATVVPTVGPIWAELGARVAFRW